MEAVVPAERRRPSPGHRPATLYDLMRSGRLRSVKDGGKRFITLDALRDYIRQLEDDADEVA